MFCMPAKMRFPLSHVVNFDMSYLPWQKSISFVSFLGSCSMVTNNVYSAGFADISISSPIFALIKLASKELTNWLDCSINWILETTNNYILKIWAKIKQSFWNLFHTSIKKSANIKYKTIHSFYNKCSNISYIRYTAR